MNHTRVDELVSAWRDARNRGTPASVVDLCRDNPELAPAVAERVATLSMTGSVAPAETFPTGNLPGPGPVESLPVSLGGYRIERILGQGGMGAVYLAHDDGLDRAVALKTMKPEIAAQPGARNRFLREAHAAAQIQHDHVIPIWQVGEDGGVPFIAMPLLQGESLADRLQRERVPPLAVTLQVGREVAEGLAAAHAHGLIHRDIKPANVWLEGDLTATEPTARFRRCRILDFGLARPANDDAHLTATGAVVGTPAYMSPEQGRGAAVDFRTDLFSLGAMLYRMATGEPPFAGRTVMAILTNLAIHHPPPPTTKTPLVSVPLSNLIMKLLMKDPAGRPGSAHEVAATLSEMAGQQAPDGDGTSIAVPAITLPTRKARRVGVWVAAALFGIATTIVAGVVVNNSMKGPKGSIVEPDQKGPERAELPTDAKASPTAPKAPSVDPGRRAALWALGCGGKAVIRLKSATGRDEGSWPVPSVEELPDGPIFLAGVLLDNCGDKVTDAGLEHLNGLHGLQTLNLSRAAVTDVGLVHLKALTELSYLNLYGTLVTDAGLEHLKGLSQMKTLHLGDTDVTDAGLAHLTGMSGLTVLDLYATAVTDAGLEHLKSLTKLETLQLSETAVTDAGLEHLKSLAKLETLLLFSTAVTDAGLEHLTGLTRLTKLDVKYAGGVSPAGAEKLKKALPNCKVILEAELPKVDEPTPMTLAADAAAHAFHGPGLLFNGKSDYVEIPSLRRDTETPSTIEAFVTVDNSASSICPIFVAGWSYVGIHAGSGNWAIYYVRNDKSLGTVARQMMKKGEKTHVAAVWDGSNMRIFVNGKFYSYTWKIFQTPAQIETQRNSITTIGSEIDRYDVNRRNNSLRGAVRELRISKVARYDKDFTPASRHESDVDTIALYHCDEGEGDVLKDSSGNGHHGKIVGAKWVGSANK